MDIKRGYRYKEKRNDEMVYWVTVCDFAYSKSGKTKYILFNSNGHIYKSTENKFKKEYEELQYENR